MAIHILASDLDGTLLNDKSKISDETAETVKKAQEAGLCFVAATGRAWNTAHPIFKEAGLEVDYVLLNGAEFRTADGSVIYQENIIRDKAEKIMDYLSVMGIDFEVNTDQGDYTTDTDMCQNSSELSDFDKFWSGNPKILKIFAFSDNLLSLEKIKKSLRKLKEITITSSAKWNIEITAADVNKGMMLKRATEFYQISTDEIMVFGDGENDEAMFRSFEHSCAVENAVPLIRGLAEKTIKSNLKNGVAKEIIELLGGM